MKYCTNCGAEVSGTFCSKCGTKIAQEVAVIDSYEKDQLLNLLYMLRAGISYISVQYDKLKNAEESADNARIKIPQMKVELNTLKKNSKKYEIMAEDVLSKNEFNFVVQEHEEKMKMARLKDRKEEKKQQVSLALLIIFSILSVLVFIPVLALSITFDLVWLFFIYFIIIPIVVASFFVYRGCDPYETMREEKEFEKFINYQNEARLSKKNMHLCLKQINNIEKSIRLLENQRVVDKDIKKLPEECEKIHASLVDTFGDVLNPQDWKNLDTIIYCLETHRANTLKEALQQSDLVVRHEELKAVIYDVGMKICATVIACTSQLSMQLEEVSENQRKIAVKLQNMNENILSASEMQKALLKKANQNSKKIMEDVHKMREYSHTRAIRDNISL